MRSDDISASRRLDALTSGEALPGSPPSLSPSVSPSSSAPSPSAEAGVWPEEWGAEPSPASGPRWEVPVRAGVVVGLVALTVVLVVAVLTLRGSPAPVEVPARPGASGSASGAVVPVAPVVSVAQVVPSGPVVPEVPTTGAGLRVHVVGQVEHPGVVSLAAGARVEDAVEAAGGATRRADLTVLNLARHVSDGERIVVPRPGETVAEPPAGGSVPSGGTGSSGGDGAAPGAPVDLNTATLAELDALPGVGPVLAGRILAWRQENGRFTRVDDLNEVTGIGEATMARLRPLVRV